MELSLTETEVRVLGSLIEKDITTPEYYPLSLNALVNACNQRSSRVTAALTMTTIIASTVMPAKTPVVSNVPSACEIT